MAKTATNQKNAAPTPPIFAITRASVASFDKIEWEDVLESVEGLHRSLQAAQDAVVAIVKEQWADYDRDDADDGGPDAAIGEWEKDENHAGRWTALAESIETVFRITKWEVVS